MAEETNKDIEDKKADAARADAEKRADEKLDMLLKGIDSVKEMMDATNRRMDAFEEEEKKKADAMRKDAEKEEEKKDEGEDMDEDTKWNARREAENRKTVSKGKTCKS